MHRVRRETALPPSGPTRLAVGSLHSQQPAQGRSATSCREKREGLPSTRAVRRGASSLQRWKPRARSYGVSLISSVFAEKLVPQLVTRRPSAHWMGAVARVCEVKQLAPCAFHSASGVQDSVSVWTLSES